MPWRIELLGRLRVAQGGRDVTPFLTQQVATLLAYLALTHSVGRQSSHPRGILIELLWPEDDPEVGRTNLRALLLRLRRQIEGAGGDFGSLLIISRGAVELHPEVVTDVTEYTAALEAAARAENPEARAQHLAAAVSLYQ
jgi:DNA-binding SARP family transcriptional activator